MNHESNKNQIIFWLDSWVKSDQVIENHLNVSGMESNHLFKNLLSHEMNPFIFLFEAIFNRFRKIESLTCLQPHPSIW